MITVIMTTITIVETCFHRPVSIHDRADWPSPEVHSPSFNYVRLFPLLVALFPQLPELSFLPYLRLHQRCSAYIWRFCVSVVALPFVSAITRTNLCCHRIIKTLGPVAPIVSARLATKHQRLPLL